MSATSAERDPCPVGRASQFITGGPVVKPTQAAFHATLPWLLLVPKHGARIAVWDYEARALVCDVDVGAESTAGIAPTDAIRTAAFCDVAHLSHTACASSLRPLPRVHATETQPQARPASNAPASDLTGGGSVCAPPPLRAATLGAWRTLPSDEAGPGGVEVVVATEAAVAHFAIGPSGAVSRLGVLPRELLPARVSSMVAYTSTTNLVAAAVALGLADGSVVCWTLRRGSVGPAGEAAESLVALTTPHGSAVQTMDLCTQVSTAEGKPRAFVTAAIGTKGGSVAHIALSAAVPPTGGADTGPGGPALAPHVLFSKKQVHDTVLAVVAGPTAPLQSVTAGDYARHPVAKRSVFALGPAALSVHEAWSGAEIRRVALPGTFKPRSVVLLDPHHAGAAMSAPKGPGTVATPTLWQQRLLVAGQSNEQLVVSPTDRKGAEVAEVITLSAHVPLTSQEEREARALRYAPHCTERLAVDIELPPPLKPAVTTYTCAVHPLRGILAVGCNEGALLLHPRDDTPHPRCVPAGHAAPVVVAVSGDGAVVRTPLVSDMQRPGTTSYPRTLNRAVATRHDTVELLPTGTFPRALAASPGGEYVAVVLSSGGAVIFALCAALPKEAVVLPRAWAQATTVTGVAFGATQPDGGVPVAFHFGTAAAVGVIAASPDRPPAVAESSVTNLQGVRRVDGGRWLGVHGTDGRLRFARWRFAEVLPGWALPVPCFVRWSPRGTACALLHTDRVIVLRVEGGAITPVVQTLLPSQPDDAAFAPAPHDATQDVLFIATACGISSLLVPRGAGVGPCLVPVASAVTPPAGPLSSCGSSSGALRNGLVPGMLARPVGRLVFLAVELQGPHPALVMADSASRVSVIALEGSAIFGAALAPPPKKKAEAWEAGALQAAALGHQHAAAAAAAHVGGQHFGRTMANAPAPDTAAWQAVGKRVAAVATTAQAARRAVETENAAWGMAPDLFRARLGAVLQQLGAPEAALEGCYA